MNKVMVTGLAIGKEIGACEVCNFDLSWLIENPSTLIWADKVILTPTMWSAIQDGALKRQKQEFGEAVQILFQKAMDENLIEVANPADVLTQEICDSLEKQVKKDAEIMADTFPGVVEIRPEVPSKNGKMSPEELRIGDLGYCPSYLISVYASLILSRIWGAQCLFGNRSFEFCKYRFGLSSRSCDTKNKAFHTVFSALMPNERILPHIATASKQQCESCGKLADCKRTYKKDLELNLSNLFKLRDYEEVQQVKAVLESIIKKTAKSKELIDYQDIVAEFRVKERALHKSIKSIFPKVTRFSNITTLISLPFALFGLATDATLLTVAGASIGGLALASKEVVELMKARASWVGFITNKERIEN